VFAFRPIVNTHFGDRSTVGYPHGLTRARGGPGSGVTLDSSYRHRLDEEARGRAGGCLCDGHGRS
jgi:hypothetical protein